MDPAGARAWAGAYSGAGPRAELVRAGRGEGRGGGDQDCVRRLRLPEEDSEGGTLQTLQTLPLPVRIRMAGGRLSVTSSRLLMFNRVAKVG